MRLYVSNEISYQRSYVSKEIFNLYTSQLKKNIWVQRINNNNNNINNNNIIC